MLRPRKHNTPQPFAEADAMTARCLLLLCITTITFSEPIPGRIPKVYNALITSNQNLEPSKAYPVYQPVLRNAFPYPLQPVFYNFPFTNSLLPPIQPALGVPNEFTPNEPPSSPSSITLKEESSTENPPEISSPEPNSNQGTEAPPPPPKTESPIPLNEFGLPPQVLPLGHFGPGYEFTQINTFPYSYRGLRFYDPYDPFLYNPYANFPLYRPLTNALAPLPAPAVIKEAPKAIPTPEITEAEATPPSEPSDLNILNYSAKDPAIPNVPPPPLPQGGLKPDNE